jgi:hypothetical protein
LSKDRAAPFSKKHRRYWIPVLGGMLAIGGINMLIGFWVYQKPSDTHEQIKLNLIPRDAAADAINTMAPSELPADVMRAFAVKYPRTLPAGAYVVQGAYVVVFPAGAPHKTATFKPDGTFVSDE